MAAAEFAPEAKPSSVPEPVTNSVGGTDKPDSIDAVTSSANSVSISYSAKPSKVPVTNQTRYSYPRDAESVKPDFLSAIPEFPEFSPAPELVARANSPSAEAEDVKVSAPSPS